MARERKLIRKPSACQEPLLSGFGIQIVSCKGRGEVRATAVFWPPSLVYSPLKDRLTYCSLFVLAAFWIKEDICCFQMEFLSWVNSGHCIGHQ